MNKLLGYVLAILGLIGIAIITIPQVSDLIQLPFTGTPLIILSVALVVIGILILIRGGKGRQKTIEVPIYQGKQVIGYRRN